MKLLDYVTDTLINDINTIELLFAEYHWYSFIFPITLYIFWMMVKYTLITMPFRMLFQPILINFFKLIKRSFPPIKQS